MTLNLFETQAKAFYSTAHTVTLWGGHGIGKTYMGTLWCLLRLVGWRDSRGYAVADTYPEQQQSMVPYFQEFIQRIEAEGMAPGGITWNSTKGEIRCPRMNSVLFLRSADKPKSLEGGDLSHAWADEVTLWKQEASDRLTLRCRNKGPGTSFVLPRPGYPEGVTFPETQLLRTFTFRRKNWAWKRLLRKVRGAEQVYAQAWQNPNLSQSYYDRLEADYGKGSPQWRQAVEGAPLEPEGLCYPYFSEAMIQEPPVNTPWRGHCQCADWGWTNPKVLLVIGMDTAGRCYILDEWVKAQVPMDDMVAAATHFRNTYGASIIFCDPSQPENIARMVAEGFNALPANNAVGPGIDLVNGRYRNGTLFISPRCTETLKEVQSYGWRVGADGTTNKDRPVDADDHCMDAKRYGIAGMDGLGLELPEQEHITMADVVPGWQEFAGGAAR